MISTEEYRVGVRVAGESTFSYNGMRFETRGEALAYAMDLAGRWTAVREYRVERVVGGGVMSNGHWQILSDRKDGAPSPIVNLKPFQNKRTADRIKREMEATGEYSSVTLWHTTKNQLSQTFFRIGGRR